jgi:SAM-dependent methyltransferase
MIMNHTLDPVQTTIRSYNLAFEEFTENTRNVNTFPGLKAELDKFISLLPGKQIVDIGFGSGRDIIYFLSKGLAVQGIELSTNFLQSLHRVVPTPLLCMDMRRLGFANNSFDGAWCCATLLHLPRVEVSATLYEFQRILRPKGILYVSVKEGGGDEWLKEGHIDLPRYFTYYSMSEICERLEREGFQVLYTQVKPHKAGHHAWLSVYALNSLGRRE